MASIYDLSVLKRHAFLVSYKETALGPLASAPEFEPETEFYNCLIYRDGAAVAASFLEKNEVRVRLDVKDTAGALSLLKNFRQRQDLLADGTGGALVFSPVVPEGVVAESLIFPNAVLLPDLLYMQPEGKDHCIQLHFRCLPDAESGNLFFLN
ncbi:MAG: hypothetical protein J6S73_00765 [Lentisphaeria bacterium]|nr:hypothetical protein [Lentisphaeria bacterium]